MKQFIKEPINIEELFPLVLEEIKLIKENFTSEEIHKLEEYIILPNSESSCLYGVMTGNCNSSRVYGFINNNLNILIKQKFFENLETKFSTETRSHFYMTPLEVYIFDEEGDDPDEVSEEAQERIDKVLKFLI